MHLTGLHLLLTYRCTFECDHCFVYSSPRAEGTLSYELGKDAIGQAAALGSVREIWFEGGEPFLYYPILLELVRFASSLGMKTGIVTNAYFAESAADVGVWLTPLRDAGLTTLSDSDDTFHSEDFPHSSTAKHMVGVARELGIQASTICIDRPGSDGRTDAKGEPITGGAVRFRGRAVEKLAANGTPTLCWDSLNECPDEDWDLVGRLHLDAYGNLFSCQGIVFGNLLKNSLNEVVANYSPDDHPVIGPLRKGGPAELVRAFDLPLRGNYLDGCHLCFLARQELRERFPAELGPPNIYGPDGA